MANRFHHQREFSWTESNHFSNESPFSGLNSQNSPRGGFSGFRLPRQGPSITLTPMHTENRRNYLLSCGFGFIIDQKIWSCSNLQATLDSAWSLQGQIKVLGRGKNRFLIKFSNLEDRQFLYEHGPWSLENSVFIVHPFVNNQVVEDMAIPKFDVWLQVWGLPLDYHTRAAAILFGNTAGDYSDCEVDEGEVKNIRYLRVRAKIDPTLPLIMGCHVKFSDADDQNSSTWVQFRYERIFRICCSCARIGHNDNKCDWDDQLLFHAMEVHRARLYARFGSDFIKDFNFPLVSRTNIAFYGSTHARRTTEIKWNQGSHDNFYSIRVNHQFSTHHPSGNANSSHAQSSRSTGSNSTPSPDDDSFVVIISASPHQDNPKNINSAVQAPDQPPANFMHDNNENAEDHLHTLSPTRGNSPVPPTNVSAGVTDMFNQNGNINEEVYVAAPDINTVNITTVNEDDVGPAPPENHNQRFHLVAPIFEDIDHMGLLNQLLSNEQSIHDGIQLVSNVGSLQECHVFEEIDPQKIWNIITLWQQNQISHLATLVGHFYVTSSLEAQQHWSNYMIMEGPWTEAFPYSAFQEDLAWVNQVFLCLSLFGYDSPRAAFTRTTPPSPMLWAQALTDVWDPMFRIAYPKNAWEALIVYNFQTQTYVRILPFPSTPSASFSEDGNGSQNPPGQNAQNISKNYFSEHVLVRKRSRKENHPHFHATPGTPCQSTTQLPLFSSSLGFQGVSAKKLRLAP